MPDQLSFFGPTATMPMPDPIAPPVPATVSPTQNRCPTGAEDLDACYRRGREDFAAGVVRYQSPWWNNSRAGKSWQRGWDDAEREADAPAGDTEDDEE